MLGVAASRELMLHALAAKPLPSFDEGTDLVLYYKHLLSSTARRSTRCTSNASDVLTDHNAGMLNPSINSFATAPPGPWA